MSETNQATATAPETTGATPVTSATPITDSGDANKQPTKAEIVAEAIRKHKLKIDGAELELEEPDVLRYAQKGFAADKRFEEAAKTRKEAEALKQMLSTDWAKALQSVGKDPYEEAVKLVKQKIDYEMMSQEQRAAFEAEQRAAAAESEKKTAQAQLEEYLLAQQAEKYRQKYDTEFAEAFKKLNVPPSPQIMQKAILQMKKALQLGVTQYTAEDAIADARDLIKQETSLLARDLDLNTFTALFGEEALNKIRKQAIEEHSKARASQTEFVRPPSEKPQMTEKPEKRIFRKEAKKLIEKELARSS